MQHCKARIISNAEFNHLKRMEKHLRQIKVSAARPPTQQCIVVVVECRTKSK